MFKLILKELKQNILEIAKNEQILIDDLLKICETLKTQHPQWQLNLHEEKLTGFMIQNLRKHGYEVTEYSIRWPPINQYINYEYYANQKTLTKNN